MERVNQRVKDILNGLKNIPNHPINRLKDVDMVETMKISQMMLNMRIQMETDFNKKKILVNMAKIYAMNNYARTNILTNKERKKMVRKMGKINAQILEDASNLSEGDYLKYADYCTLINTMMDNIKNHENELIDENSTLGENLELI